MGQPVTRESWDISLVMGFMFVCFVAVALTAH
jgi:hypothetical protein